MSEPIPNLPPAVQDELNRSIEFSEWLQANLSTSMVLEEEVNRYRLALVFFNIALETREAVLLLVGNNARSPAVALGRPMLDALVRGLWFRHAATSAQVQAFLDGQGEPKFEGMLKGLRGTVSDHAIESVRKQFKTFSDFTHSSHRQVARWLATEDHSPGHSDRDMIQLLQAVDRFGLAAATRREEMAGTDLAGFQEQVTLVTARIKAHEATRERRPSQRAPQPSAGKRSDC